MSRWIIALLLTCASAAQAAPATASPEEIERIERFLTDKGLLLQLDDVRHSVADKAHVVADRTADLIGNAMGFIGVPYRRGGTSASTGFDCSGFIGYLFREEAGMNLPRSTREMINVDAPLVARNNLKPGDLLFFSTSGRGRVSHAGIYLGDNQFIHSSSRRSGGVRVDNLGDSYWSKTFIEAKRALAMAPTTITASK